MMDLDITHALAATHLHDPPHPILMTWVTSKRDGQIPIHMSAQRYPPSSSCPRISIGIKISHHRLIIHMTRALNVGGMSSSKGQTKHLQPQDLIAVKIMEDHRLLNPGSPLHPFPLVRLLLKPRSPAPPPPRTILTPVNPIQHQATDIPPDLNHRRSTWLMNPSSLTLAKQIQPHPMGTRHRRQPILLAPPSLMGPLPLDVSRRLIILIIHLAIQTTWVFVFHLYSISFHLFPSLNVN